MDKQEFNEGHIAEALDRCHIITTMIEDFLLYQPAIEKMKLRSHVLTARSALCDLYQELGQYEDKEECKKKTLKKS